MDFLLRRIDFGGRVCFGCLLAVGGSFVVGVLRVDYLDFVLRRIFTLNYFIFAWPGLPEFNFCFSFREASLFWVVSFFRESVVPSCLSFVSA